MSVDIHWDTLTSGLEGEQIAETVREFLHEKFQQVTLPRFIRSVRVHAFDFGSIPPKVEIRDICDPLPDFYDDNEDGYSSQNDDRPDAPSDERPILQSAAGVPDARANHRSHTADVLTRGASQARQDHVANVDARAHGPADAAHPLEQPTSPLFTNLQSPGIPGGTSNLTYFHLPFGPGLSGTTTPLAAVAGAHFQAGWPDNALNARTAPLALSRENLQTPPSISDLSSRPQSQHQHGDPAEETAFGFDALSSAGLPAGASPYAHESNPNDIQIVAHVTYTGDLRLSLTAEILLDYPMPSFVGIPLQLNITGVRFDGIAILAYIKKRAHLCFLSPEDAEAFIDKPSSDHDSDRGDPAPQSTFGSLLEEIRVESEIGEKENGKQVLKNVGKVEKFILEQVRRIFEDEFVYPSFWTFLV